MPYREVNTFHRESAVYVIAGCMRPITEAEADEIISKWKEHVMEVEFAAWRHLPENWDWKGNDAQKKRELYHKAWGAEGTYLIDASAFE